MARIAIFGKPGGGKSTLSKKLSRHTGIKFYSLDLIEYKNNGERIPLEEYTKKHNELISADHWIIDGLGPLDSFWQRIDAADTVIYIDLPYLVHYWWVIKRLVTSGFVKPEGWPEGSSVFQGTITSLKFLRLSPKFWTPELFNKIKQRAAEKKFYKITSIKQMNNFTIMLTSGTTRNNTSQL